MTVVLGDGATALLWTDNWAPVGRVCHFAPALFAGLRLPALMDLYIHPLYVLVSKILSSILNSPALIHPLYHPLSTLLLWDRLVTLSKYIHV
jgi:hypothetical protein